jgi:hypothetical protein
MMPLFFLTEDAARLALRVSEKDYQQFVEAVYSPAASLAGDSWQNASLIFFADLLITAGEKIKQFAAHPARASFQTR